MNVSPFLTICKHFDIISENSPRKDDSHLKRRIFIVATIAMAAFLLNGLGFLISSHLASSVRNRIDKPLEVYQVAVSSISAQDSLALQAQTTTTHKVADSIFTGSANTTLQYANRNSEDLQVSVLETLHFGSYTTQIQEIYADETAYLQMQDSLFYSGSTSQEFVDRYSPTFLLDPSLYKTITGIKSKDGAILHFDNATAPEASALPSGATFVKANGIAYLDGDHSLSKTEYTIVFQFGSATITKTTTVTVLSEQTFQIAIPDDTSDYTYLTYIDGPRMLEITSGYLLQATVIEGQYTEDIQCKAFGDAQKKNVLVKMADGKEFVADITSVVTLTSNSRSGGPVVLEQTETFEDGTYHISTNHSESEVDDNMTKDTMISRCQDILLGTLPLSGHIQDSNITVLEDCYRIEFSGNAELSELISKNVCETLYNDTKILEQLSSDHLSSSLECYLEISKDSGIPIRSGIDYSGIYVIDNISYPLIFQAEQTYQLQSQ